MGKNTDRKEYLRQYYQDHKETYRETARRWRQRNPEKVKEINRQQYLKRKARKENENRSD